MEKELSKSYIKRLSLSHFLDKDNNSELIELYDFITYLLEKGYLDFDKIIENEFDINLASNTSSASRKIIIDYIDIKNEKQKHENR